MRFWGSSKLDEIGWCWMHIQAWIWWQGILLQSQFSLFLCILKPEAYAQKLDRSKTPAQLHIMNWHPDIKTRWCDRLFFKIDGYWDLTILKMMISPATFYGCLTLLKRGCDWSRNEYMMGMACASNVDVIDKSEKRWYIGDYIWLVVCFFP